MNERRTHLAAGLAGWSIRHPVGVVMLTLALMLLGLFALERLRIDLLPHIIYPDVRVRVSMPGTPATVMEDEVTRQLEEQLAITEDAIAVESRTREGRSAVDLSFRYGADIDKALRDASSRLDRAKRFLPEDIEPPVIYKRDPAQRPVAEYIVSSAWRGPVALREWVDDRFGKWLLNLPGVAAVETGGGLRREIQVLADPYRLAAIGMDLPALRDVIAGNNVETPAGRLEMDRTGIVTRTAARLENADALRRLPLPEGDGRPPALRLGDIAEIVDGAERQRLRIRLNGRPGVKVSLQKQPAANTVAVVDAVDGEIARLRADGLVPQDIVLRKVDDQAHYIRQAVNNAAGAALSGGVLAMLVVYLFLGDVRRTLIIGSAIPVAILVTLALMAAGGLTLNIMTLGGLALGIGMLVDSTIVMMENLSRHQRAGDADCEQAAAEVHSAIVASTATNLSAVLPFLFIGGLVGLLFRELIFTVSAAILASMLIALTLVPALAARIDGERRERPLQRVIDGLLARLAGGYARLLERLLRPFATALVIVTFLAALAATLPWLLDARQSFLPRLDEGRVSILIRADRGIDLDAMDELTRRVEAIVAAQPEVDTRFTTVGGFVFGRSQFEAPNFASIQVALRPADPRKLSTRAWIARVKRRIDAEGIVGARISLRSRGLRGVRTSRGNDEIALRITGPDLERLTRLGDAVAERLKSVDGLSNIEHSGEEVTQEFALHIDRQRAAALGLDARDIGRAVRLAVSGERVGSLVVDDRRVDILLRADRAHMNSPDDLESVLLFSKDETRAPIHLGDLARVELVSAPASIWHDRQQRIVEITASPTGDSDIENASARALAAAREVALPPGYVLYEAGNLETLKKGRDTGRQLLALALFLVFVAMAVQYESLRNPLIILLGVPFALTGVALGLHITGLPVSMPVWLGLIMLAGIVVNNAIVLVEYIELLRARGHPRHAAILAAARLRLRPILMTTLTTVVGMLPLALALSEGAELLQPLAVTIVSGLAFSLLVSLLLIPLLYAWLGAQQRLQRKITAASAL